MWNFTPKFDTILVIYGYLQDSQENVHSLSLFSLVESNGTMQMNYFMQTRWFKQIHGDMNQGFSLVERKPKRIHTFCPIVILASCSEVEEFE